jgi:SAM-dependent methyltransferase
MPLQHSPAAERNSTPILERLRAVLGSTSKALDGEALEIASGTGQHAAAFAAALPGWQWQPSDWQADAFDSIAGWAAQAGASNVRPPVLLDVRSARWPAEGLPFESAFDLMYCANMLHITPWDCCAGLMQGAARHLAPSGVLVTYGPYLEDGVPTAPGNAAFDQSLRERSPAWGIRRLSAVLEDAQRAGLQLRERHALPANNLLLVFGRTV